MAESVNKMRLLEVSNYRIDRGLHIAKLQYTFAIGDVKVEASDVTADGWVDIVESSDPACDGTDESSSFEKYGIQVQRLVNLFRGKLLKETQIAKDKLAKIPAEEKHNDCCRDYRIPINDTEGTGMERLLKNKDKEAQLVWYDYDNNGTTDAVLFTTTSGVKVFISAVYQTHNTLNLGFCMATEPNRTGALTYLQAFDSLSPVAKKK